MREEGEWFLLYRGAGEYNIMRQYKIRGGCVRISIGFLANTVFTKQINHRYSFLYIHFINVIIKSVEFKIENSILT